MSLLDATALIVSICTIVAFATGSIKWLVKHYLAELRPNGGSSLKDQVNRLEVKIAEVDQDNKSMELKIDKMFETLLSHIARTDK
jgi:hypothetical protein